MGIIDKVKSAIGEGGLSLAHEAGSKFLAQGLSSKSDAPSTVPPPPLGQVPVEREFSAQVISPIPSLQSDTSAHGAAQGPLESAAVQGSAPDGVVMLSAPKAGHVDQILQLHQMLQDGLISRDEFEVLKSGLFSSS